MQKLEKRCPKCGWVGRLGFARSADQPYFGRCEACGFTAPAAVNPDAAKAKWNMAKTAEDQQGALTIPT